MIQNLSCKTLVFSIIELTLFCNKILIAYVKSIPNSSFIYSLKPQLL
jgi:hypothetical protein